MNFCPHCGSAIGASDTNCPKCGRAITTEEDAAARKEAAAALNRSFKKTVIGVVGPSAGSRPGRTSPPRIASKPTLLGMPTALPRANSASSPTDGSTTRAIESDGGVSPGAQRPGSPEARAQGARGMSAVSSLDGSLAPPGPKTAMGVPGRPEPPAGDPGKARPAQEQPPHTKTMVGVATQENTPPQEPAEENHLAPPGPAAEPHPTPDPGLITASAPEFARLPSAPPPFGDEAPRSYQSAAIAIGGGLVLATIAAAFAIFWRSPAPLRAEARVDATGTDVLRLSCDTCPEGTTLRIGASRASVIGESAELPLSTPLKVGDNIFTVDIDRPGDDRDETVPLLVKIGYRIRPDPSPLDSDQPKLRIAVEGAPFAMVEMNGAPLSLGAQGFANYDLDISGECMGTSDELKTIERSIPYSVSAANGGAEQGVVSLRVAVPPLRIDSPGQHAVVETDHVQLSGRTGRGARLLAGDQLIGVAADGSFSRSLALPAFGPVEVKLRAHLPGQAPRIATLKLKRVEKLADEARDFVAQSPLSFATLMEGVGQHVGERIALSGEVVEARVQGAKILALLNVRGCARPPCLARVVAAATEDLTRGQMLDVFGYVNGSVGQGDAGPPVAEIESAFIMKKR